jgi:hypothetical protein
MSSWDFSLTDGIHFGIMRYSMRLAKLDKVRPVTSSEELIMDGMKYSFLLFKSLHEMKKLGITEIQEREVS